MTQQINLINPDLRKKRELLAATPLAIATGVMLIILIVSAIFVKQRANASLAEADQQAAVLKTAQDKLVELSKAVSTLKPNQQLADELANSRSLLNLREEVIAALEGGAFSNAAGFAEYLRGFARQAPPGLWLSGFTIAAGGEEMEIRGRMLDPVTLPEYIQRLNSEKAFQGHSFSTLTILRPPPTAVPPSAAVPPPTAAPSATAGIAATAKPAATSPGFVDFVLTSPGVDSSKSSAQNAAEGFSETKR